MLHFGVCKPLQGLKGRHSEADIGGECYQPLNPPTIWCCISGAISEEVFAACISLHAALATAFPPGSWNSVLQWDLFLQHSHWNLFNSVFDQNVLFICWVFFSFSPHIVFLDLRHAPSLWALLYLESDPRAKYTWVCLFLYFKGSPHVAEDKLTLKCL